MNPLNTRPNLVQMFQQVRNNPSQFLSQLGIPQNITSPQDAVQWLLRNGRVSQMQINQAQTMLPQIQKMIR